MWSGLSTTQIATLSKLAHDAIKASKMVLIQGSDMHKSHSICDTSDIGPQSYYVDPSNNQTSDVNPDVLAIKGPHTSSETQSCNVEPPHNPPQRYCIPTARKQLLPPRRKQVNRSTSLVATILREILNLYYKWGYNLHDNDNDNGSTSGA